MEIDQLVRSVPTSGGANRGGADGANAKRKLESSGPCFPSSGLVETVDAAGEFATALPRQWSAASLGATSLPEDSQQPRVRRRGSAMEPATPNATMKRSCSEGKIARAVGMPMESDGCEVSPSMATPHSAQEKSGSPRLPRYCWSPNVNGDLHISDEDEPAIAGKRPLVYPSNENRIEQVASHSAPLPTSTPLAKHGTQQFDWNVDSTPTRRAAANSPLPPPHQQQKLNQWSMASTESSLANGGQRGNTQGIAKRAWQPPRRSRNPGNLSLDLSQVDQEVPEALCSSHQQNDQAAVCSQVTDFLFIGGAIAAKDKDTLTQAGITHIINCAAAVAPDFYPEDFLYYNVRLRDHSSQDMARHFYNVFDFIERARKCGGRIFVHCVKGISRSPTMAIAYLMWYKRINMYQALDFVRQARPAVDPNAGFIFQLTEWEQLHLKGKIQLHRPAVFRVELDPRVQVNDPAKCNGNDARPAERPMIVGPLLDIEERFFQQPSGEITAASFVVASADYMFIWCGRSASAEQIEAAQTASELLQQYEGFPPKCDLLYQGSESPAFWSLLESAAPPGE